MTDSSSDNKRIAKNTLLLYGRMLYGLFISLFTARVVLNALGFEDYGLYNVIGSIVSMFVFLRLAMGNSVHRYITFALGKGDEDELKKIFSMSLIIHTAIAILIVILSEAIGVWFLNTHMEIPMGREVAANWVFQISVFTCALSVICVPYDAEIIAHERMGAFAILSIVNSTLTLGIVYAVKYFPGDKLIFYAFLLMMVQVMNRVVYGAYCKKNFAETKFLWVMDKQLFKEMMGFAGWSLIGNLAYVGYTQGLNVLLNIFFGTIINAARGIAVQVQGAIKGFVTNFQVAVKPQITKTYACGDYKRMHSLIYFSSKFSFFLLYCLVLPICIEAEVILRIWLHDVPDYTIAFTRLTLLMMLVDPLSNPIGIANSATGKIRTYQLVEGGMLLVILPLAWFALKVTNNPVSAFLVQLVILYIVQIVRVVLVCHKINMSIWDYCFNIILRLFIVSITSAMIPLFLYKILSDNIIAVAVVIIISVLSVVVCSYFLGLNKRERLFVASKINLAYHNLRKRLKI